MTHLRLVMSWELIDFEWKRILKTPRRLTKDLSRNRDGNFVQNNNYFYPNKLKLNHWHWQNFAPHLPQLWLEIEKKVNSIFQSFYSLGKLSENCIQRKDLRILLASFKGRRNYCKFFFFKRFSKSIFFSQKIFVVLA